MCACVHVFDEVRACRWACVYQCVSISLRSWAWASVFYVCVCVCVHALMRVYVRTRVNNCVRLYSYMRAYMRQRLRTYVRVCTSPIYDRACAHIIMEAGVGVA